MIHVLCVDDEIINLQLFSLSFRSDFSILTALSAMDALKILDKETIDVVITDLRMPGMDGIELINHIKEKFPQKKCILLTGYYEAGLIEEPDIKNKVFKYLGKPYKKDELRQIILSACA
jgi:YesN/AraC family two-component response regulator